MDARTRCWIAPLLLAVTIAPRPVEEAHGGDEAVPARDAAASDGDETPSASPPDPSGDAPGTPPLEPDDPVVPSSPPVTPPAAAPPTPDGTTSVMVTPPEDDAPARIEEPPSPRPPPVPARLPAGGATAPAMPMVTATGAAPALLTELLEPLAGHASAQAYARPLTLLESLNRAGDPARRLWIVQAYWKTAVAFATVKSCSLAGQRIDLVAPGGDPHDRAVLDVAVAAARADLAEAIALLGTTQQELIDLARLPPAEPPPWPVDRPLATPYQTHFDSIFAQRIATGRVRAIARTLPARHESLEARALATRAATEVFAMAEADHAKGRRPIEAVVAAHASLVSQEREFLRVARAYNTDIAEYAMAVADLSVPDEAFVAMLIGSPAAPRTVMPAVFPAGASSQPPVGSLP